MITYKNVMVDIETLGTAPGSVILSIGAVAFNEGQPEADWATFNSGPINVASSIEDGLDTDEATLAWWRQQSNDAREVLTAAQTGGTEIRKALRTFAVWFPPEARIWGNGANFDEPLLTAAYKATGIALPWKYYSSYCYRTMKNLFGNVVLPPEFQGVKHNALADALHQTRHLQAILLHIQAVRECL